ncbi:hypothetical protein HMPREF0991_01973 [Lachnospiraceae bacterium 2_1_58FAA]|nr:hypothetical protein HMPREF0991_01973 [Lachnospiraceae bacterium 2_1_58FAA]
MLDINEIQKISMDCSMTEFVGTTVLDTIGLVIPGVNDALLQQMQIDKPYKSLGLLSSRTGAAGQINAADEAVKIYQHRDHFHRTSEGYQRMGRSRKLYHHRRLQCIRCAPCRRDCSGIYGKVRR